MRKRKFGRTSLVFTKVEETSSKYKLTVSIQGTSTRNEAELYVYFYDANDRVLAKVEFDPSVSTNAPFNTIDSTYVDKEVYENAVRIGFYSYSGEPAAEGIQDFRGTTVGDVHHVGKLCCGHRYLL